MRVNAKTDIGLLRQANEDSYSCENPRLCVVADGMGGHVAGEIASKLGVDTVKQFIDEAEKDADIDEEILKKAICHANGIIFQQAQKKQQYNGMGTTISLIYLNGDRCLWAHVGDSRIYLCRNEQISQLTSDHSLVWDLVANGSISAEEAASHPQKNLLTRAVGVDEEVEIDTGVLTVGAQDKILLCSDGLTNMVGDAKIREIITATQLSKTADLLIAEALAAGGVDNITAVLVEV